MGVDAIATRKDKKKEADETMELLPAAQETQPTGEAQPHEEGKAARKKTRKKDGQPETPQRQEGLEEGAPEGDAAAQTEPPAEGQTGFALQYDVNSDKRYVDSTSQKTDFEKMLDELSNISKEMLSWEVEKFTRKHHSDAGEASDTAKKFEAFLGGFITNAAIELYDRGYQDIAFQRLEQAKNILSAKRKLETEVESIKAANEEDAVDLSDMLGLFGPADGDSA